MEKIIEIPEGYEARIEGNNVVLEPKESEDERIRKALVNLVYSDVNELIGGVEKRLCVSWLEKQKIPEGSPTPDLTTMLVPNRYNEQKPAEWSEEDRTMRKKILKYLVTRCSVNEYEEVEEWLNNIRPQPHWKPSEEQMVALLTAIAIVGSDKYEQVTNTLILLHKQLKKLM